MPYWNISCLWCLGAIIDALLECVPTAKRSDPAYRRLFDAEPGAALACPYCGGLIGFDDDGKPQRPLAGWPVFRYGLAELEVKKVADGEPATTPLSEWALRYRFTQPGSHLRLIGYLYAGNAPVDEAVP